MDFQTLAEIMEQIRRWLSKHFRKHRNQQEEHSPNLFLPAAQLEFGNLGDWSAHRNQAMTVSFPDDGPVIPPHAVSVKDKNIDEDFAGEAEKGQDEEGTGEIHNLPFTPSEVEFNYWIWNAEENLERDRQKLICLILLKRENARINVELAQAWERLSMQELWQEKFRSFRALKTAHLCEKELAWQVERAALTAEIARLQRDEQRQTLF